MANEKKQIDLLEARIDKAIKEISKGEKTPKETEIGKLLNELKALDEASYAKKTEMYRPVSKEYFEKYRQTDEYKKSPEYKKSLELEKKKKLEAKKALEFAESLRSTGGGGGYLSDEEVSSGPRAAKPVKDPKIKKGPVVKLPKASKSHKEKGDRDRTGYTFEGESYGKGPLVLAILRKHVLSNPKTTYDSLKKTFPDDLLKGYGIFQSYERAMEISKVRKRFFLNDNQLIRLRDKNIAICNQFSSDNILPFLAHARKLGFKID